MRLRSLLYLAGVVFGICTGSVAAFETETTPVENKLEELERNKEQRKQRIMVQGYEIPAKRTSTLRDAGREETLLFVNEANFRFVRDIGFYVPRLVVALRANDPTAPVVFDDPLSFSITPLKGTAVLDSTQLNALFNEHVFNFPGATVKDLKITTSPGVLTLAGKMMRTKWVPFQMKGPLKLAEGHLLTYTPTEVIVDGVDATKVLAVANATLDELLKVKAVGAELIGSTIHLDTMLLFPPPKLNLNIKAVRLESIGLVLEFDQGNAPAFPEPLIPTKSYMIAKGGDVKFMRAMPVDVGLQIVSTEPDTTLDFNLYRYREQIANGFLKLTPDGQIMAHMLNYTRLPHTQARAN